MADSTTIVRRITCADFPPHLLYEGKFDFGDDWRMEWYCIEQTILQTDYAYSYEDGIIRFQELDWPDGYCTYMALRRDFENKLAISRYVFCHIKDNCLYFPWEEWFVEAQAKGEKLRDAPIRRQSSDLALTTT